MNILRLCKALICLPLSLFALLVGIDNLIDYNSNYSFVQHVLSMDTVFASNTLKWRAISNPLLWHLGYGAIIFGELLTGALFLIAFIHLITNIQNRLAFVRSKNWVYLGCIVAFGVWFFGFIVIGGEWFDMWQSEQWNGIEAAFRIVMIFMATLIFISLPESENAKTNSD